ncbi:MAG: SDR family oxidoreductase [Burkholderiales bacterium]|nr:SDR family oxidoreductase [Burkholderiales bacterium]
MKVLILGGDGMLGHRLLRHLAPRHAVKVTLRQSLAAYRQFGVFDANNAFDVVDVRDTDRLLRVVAEYRPEAIVNCVGIVKQRAEAKDAIPSLEINTLLPHRLASLARACDARLIHLSTDCVFSGSRGNYRESDPIDAEDLYGRSKALGEVSEPGCLTLRTSIIGPELLRKTGLLEWFLAQRGGAVKGYTRAVFSGFTTTEMARVIELVLNEREPPAGMYHVSSAPIAKNELLSRINRALDLGITITPDEQFACDRSLDSSRFRGRFAYTPPSWDEMIAELASELRQEQT